MPLIHVTDTAQAQAMCDLINPWIAASPAFYGDPPPYRVEVAAADIARGSVWAWQTTQGIRGGVIAHQLTETDPDTGMPAPTVFVSLLVIDPTVNLSLNLANTVIHAVATVAKQAGIGRIYTTYPEELVAGFRAANPQFYYYLKTTFRVLRDDDYGFTVDFKS